MNRSAAAPAAYATRLPRNVPMWAPLVQVFSSSLYAMAEIGQPDAAECLAHGHDVGHGAGVLQREHLAGPTEARLHLVGDHHDTVPAARLAHAREEPGGRHDGPALTLDRLHDDRRGRADARVWVLEDVLEIRGALQPAVPFGLPKGAAVAVRVGHEVRFRHERQEAVLERAPARDRQRAGRHAVIGPLECDDRHAVGIELRELQRRLDGVRSGRPAEGETRQTAGQDSIGALRPGRDAAAPAGRARG